VRLIKKTSAITAAHQAWTCKNKAEVWSKLGKLGPNVFENGGGEGLFRKGRRRLQASIRETKRTRNEG